MIKKIILLLLVLFIFTGCSDDDIQVINPPKPSKIDEIPETELYKGNSLQIAVVGEAPTVREKNLINFNRITLDAMKDINATSYDAIFIRKEFLKEAAEKKYVRVYQSTDIPIFFIEPERRLFTYTHEDITYEDGYNLDNQEFAIGYQAHEEGNFYWAFGLYNDIKNEQTIQATYSLIFESIEDAKDKEIN